MALLTVWLVGGCLALIQVGDQQQTIQYVGTSFYLPRGNTMFACLFGGGDPARLSILRRGYLLAALIATMAGYIGFFHLLPGSDRFLFNDRVSATFKDPNVYGPFLIFPLLMLMTALMTRGIRILNLALAAFLLGGLFLSFFARRLDAFCRLGRGHRRDPHRRLARSAPARAYSAVRRRHRGRHGVAGGGDDVDDTVRDLFLERAKAIQPYDVGPGGRFWEQRLALGVILDHPNGMGPFEFSRVFGMQQHDVYMQGFLVYGWLDGAAYLTLVAVTLAVGLATVRVPAPWQNYLIVAYATFVGEAVEGLIVDTDHWRHFFLLLGLIWGLAVATINLRRRAAWERRAAAGDALAASWR